MFKRMFAPKNVGTTIKNWAVALGVIEAVGSIPTGIVILCDWGIEDGWWALFIIFFGPIAAWIASVPLYAIGQLIEDVHAIRNKEGTTAEVEEKERQEYMRKREERAKRAEEEETEFFCPNCKNIVAQGEFVCKSCGQRFDWSNMTELEEQKVDVHCTCGAIIHGRYCPACGKTTNAPRAEPTHKWRCDGCGKMRTQTPCEYCGKE